MIINKLRGRAQFVGGIMVGTGNARMLESVTVLTAAQIKNLQSSPITLIAAPGATRFLDIVAIQAKLTYSTAQFTGGNNLEFRYTGAAGDKVTADLSSTFLNSSSTSYALVHGVVTAQTPVLNAALKVCVPTANPGGATAASTLTLRVLYRIVTP